MSWQQSSKTEYVLISRLLSRRVLTYSNSDVVLVVFRLCDASFFGVLTQLSLCQQADTKNGDKYWGRAIQTVKLQSVVHRLTESRLGLILKVISWFQCGLKIRQDRMCLMILCTHGSARCYMCTSSAYTIISRLINTVLLSQHCLAVSGSVTLGDTAL